MVIFLIPIFKIAYKSLYNIDELDLELKRVSNLSNFYYYTIILTYYLSLVKKSLYKSSLFSIKVVIIL
jgi:hypothetical protein